jgi:hypothetical protein
MPTATITVDSNLKARLADLANQTGPSVDDFVGALLRRIADADIHFERNVPVFPPRPGAPVLTVEDVDRLANGNEAQSREDETTVTWPDIDVRGRRIVGDRVLPNLVLLERGELTGYSAPPLVRTTSA